MTEISFSGLHCTDCIPKNVALSFSDLLLPCACDCDPVTRYIYIHSKFEINHLSMCFARENQNYAFMSLEWLGTKTKTNETVCLSGMSLFACVSLKLPEKLVFNNDSHFFTYKIMHFYFSKISDLLMICPFGREMGAWVAQKL